MIRSNELCHSHLSALLPPSASAAPSQHQQSAWPQPTPSMVLKSLFTRHYLTQPPSNRLAVILGHCKLGLLGKRISRWQYSNSPMASLSRYSRLVHEFFFVILLSTSSRTMFSTWRLSKEVGQEEEEVELVEETENKSKRPAGVLSLARTLSSEQLCQLVKSEFFSIFWFTFYLQVHSIPTDNPGEVCFWAWKRWDFKKQMLGHLNTNVHFSFSGIIVCVGLVLTFLHANSVLRQQV